jgi:hypothetical protein
MPVFGLGAPVVPDYFVLALLLVGFLVAGLARLIAHLMRSAPEADPEREHYADESDQT